MKDWNEIDRNLSVYRQNSTVWWCQVKVPKEFRIRENRIRRSTKEKDFLKAVVAAGRIRDEIIIRKENGLEIVDVSPTIQKVCNDVASELEDKKPFREIYKTYIYILLNEIKPFFGRKKIKEIDRLELKIYFEQLKSKSKTKLTTTRTAFKYIFEYCLDRRYIKSTDIPKFPKVEATDRESRNYFNRNDKGIIDKAFSKYIKSPSRNWKVEYNKILLQKYFYTLITTGMRPGEETAGLQWRHLSKEKLNNEFRYIINIEKGKTKRRGGREIPLSSIAGFHILDLMAKSHNMKIKEGKEKGIVNPDVFVKKYPDEYIFGRPKDNKVPQFEKLFSDFISYCDHLSCENFVLYCCRHTFITNKLRKGTPIHLVAKHCGTSTSMIEQYYSKLSSTMNFNEIYLDDDSDIMEY